jgi:hypothetical protein
MLSETSVDFQHIIRRYIPEDITLEVMKCPTDPQPGSKEQGIETQGPAVSYSTGTGGCFPTDTTTEV